MIKDLIKKYVIRRKPPKLDTVDDIKIFKSNAWKSKKMANYYSKEVEKRFFNEVTGNIFTEEVKPGSYVLDVGAGTGRLSFFLADNGCKVIASDISKEMLRHINEEKGDRDIETLECSGYSIPMDSETFDAVVALEFMLHFPDWDVLLKEQARLCKKGGTIMFSFLSSDNTDFLRANRKNLSNINDFFVQDFAPFANEKQLREVAEKLGLELKALIPVNFFANNSIFGCNLEKAQVDAFGKYFNEAIKDENVMNFVKNYEKQIVRNLPISCCVSMIVKFTKT